MCVCVFWALLPGDSRAHLRGASPLTLHHHHRRVCVRLHPPAARTEEHPPPSQTMTRSVTAWRTWPGTLWTPSPAPSLQPSTRRVLQVSYCVPVQVSGSNWILCSLCDPLVFLFWPWGNFKWVTYETRDRDEQRREVLSCREPSRSEPTTAAGPGHSDDSPERTPAFIRGRVYFDRSHSRGLACSVTGSRESSFYSLLFSPQSLLTPAVRPSVRSYDQYSHNMINIHTTWSIPTQSALCVTFTCSSEARGAQQGRS